MQHLFSKQTFKITLTAKSAETEEQDRKTTKNYEGR